MKTRQRVVCSWLSALLLALVAPVTGEEQSEGTFSGEFSLGLRVVDTGGAERKFKEDINLEDGPRLFGLRFDLVPSGGNRRYADRIELDMTNFGGDPFETLHFGARKYGAYNLRYDRVKSDYFYNDVIVPHDLSNVSTSDGGDFHTFDFERVRDTAKLDVNINQASKITFGFDRYTKRGDSTTTLDISRDEFELDQSIDESLNSYTGAYQYAWDKVTLVLQGRVRDFENAVEIFLPGFSEGENPDGANVDFFFLDQPYDFTSLDQTVRLMARPTSRLDVSFVGSFQDLDLDLHATESSQGIGFDGVPFTTDRSGAGDIVRDLEQFAVELSFEASPRIALVGKVREQSLDQDGNFPWGGELNEGDWTLDLSGFELGIDVAVSPQVNLAAGLVEESRDVNYAWAVEGEGNGGEKTTDNSGYFASLAWRPSKAAELTVDVENNTFDDPFTLSAPTDRERYRVRGRYKLANGTSLIGAYTMKDYANDNSGWNADTEIANLRINRRGDQYSASLGYSSVDIERAIDQTVQAGFLQVQFPIFYRADSDFFDGRFSCNLSDGLAIGGNFRLYEGNGSFALERDDYRGWIEIDVFSDYVLHLGYRVIDYDESDFNFDDYDADIVELSLGYRW